MLNLYTHDFSAAGVALGRKGRKRNGTGKEKDCEEKRREKSRSGIREGRKQMGKGNPFPPLDYKVWISPSYAIKQKRPTKLTNS